MTYFVLVNRTSEVAIVKYSVDPATTSGNCVLAPPYRNAPQLYSAKNLARQIRKVRREDATFRLDTASCTIEVNLKPEQGLLLWQISGYAYYGTIGERTFLTNVEMSGSAGDRTYVGPGLDLEFSEATAGVHVLLYGPES